MYTIGQVSKMFGLPISTLRYYDKEGLFPDMERSSGIRRRSAEGGHHGQTYQGAVDHSSFHSIDIHLYPQKR